MNYQLMLNNNCIIKTEANGMITYIPVAEGNRDYQDYKKWVSQGNTPLKATF